jgi:hypothetical protein
MGSLGNEFIDFGGLKFELGFAIEWGFKLIATPR